MNLCTKESRDLHDIHQIRSKEKHQGLDQWAADFSRKAKTHLQKTGLEQSLRDMKEHLAYLEKLCSKTIGSRKAAQSSYKYQQNVRGNSIHSYGPTRQASQVLYNVLLGACNKHSEHRIHLCVEVKQPTLTMRSEFLFTLAFSHLDAEMEPLWLEVKTLVDEVTQPGERLSGSALGDCLSEKLSHADQELPANESQKRRQLTMQLKPTVIESDQHALNRPVSSSGEVSIDGNICEFLRRWCPLQHETVQCVGILPRLSCWKCIVSPARAPHKHKSLRPMSLSKLISLIAKQDDLRILMIGERIRLARLLTTALLRYYSTNWSLACCQSEQIHLFDINEAEPLKPMKLTYPHLAARIQSSNGTHSVQPGEDKLKRVKGAPNTEFFYLSILLLQIAHGKNWARLQEENPLRIDIYGEDAEYDRVLDLARRRDSGMPPRYHQAIVNLLKCSAIESEVVEGRIQEIVHQDVIMPLEELEKLSLED